MIGKSSAVFLLATSFASVAAARPSTWMQQRTANFHRDDRRFDSSDYGFSVAPPPEAAQYVTNGGDANHGPIMILGERRDIVVYPTYTNPEFDDAKPCLHTDMPWEATSTRVVGATRLGAEHGCMVTFTRSDAVWRSVQAMGRGRGEGILYTLLLTTNRQWAHRDFASFRRVAASFRRLPIYP